MTESDLPTEHEWERGWDAHESAQRRRLARLPLAEKLQWLEEAQRVLEHMKRDGGSRAPGGADLLRDAETDKDVP